MYNRDPRTETKVGFFVLFGVAVVAVTVVYFGRLGQGLQSFYDLEVDFPNASGLLAGSDVLLGGARIGYVAKPPRVLPAMQGVAVELKINEEVSLPVMSEFIIGSSGLLGNRFIDVIVSPEANLDDKLRPGAKIKGVRETGMEDLTRDASTVMADVRQAVGTLNKALDRLDSTALSQASLQDLRDTIANLKQGSEGFTEIGKAADNLEAAAADARKLMSSARSGSGPLPMLLNDKQAAADLRAILSNIRRHGVLWYKDSYRPESSR
ncbi:MAG: MlaD family protein [Chthoniobacterales bacterium]|jgi:phospholipid/cholesterol/gamma-HCH transport system substrate-binding protein